MDFTLTDEQRMMRDSVRELLAAHCQTASLRRMLDRGEPSDPGRWRRLMDLGLGGVLVPETQGGLGLAEMDFIAIAEESGRALLPEPLVEQAGIALPLLAGLDVGLIDALIAGDRQVAVGHPINPCVSGADTADLLILAHGDEIHLVERRDVDLERRPSVDPFRRLFQVHWAPKPATRIASDGMRHWHTALERGALFAAAECLGIAERAVEIAVAYANQRMQFGKLIGSYQAIKHHLATAQVQIEFARPAIQAAAALFDPGDVWSQVRVSHANLAAQAAADLACRTAIQVHGAMGYSWEVDIHFHLKRTLALAGAWGDRSFHRHRVARRLFEGNAPLGPDQTFTRKSEQDAA